MTDLCKKFPKLVLVNFTADHDNGRFVSQDSYRGELGDPGQWHLYAYCANNPINYVDPSGHISAPIKTITLFGYMITQSVHYNRNKFNTDIPKTRSNAKNAKWVKQSYRNSLCHQFNKKNGKNNLKYLSPDGMKEAVYYGGGGKKWCGKLNNTEEDKGTFNYGPGTGIPHAALDVVPYMLWGNSKKDTTTIWKASKAMRSDIWKKVKSKLVKWGYY